MISGALCLTHGSINLHFIQVTAPDNDVVNEVPVFGPGMRPRSFVHVTELEELEELADTSVAVAVLVRNIRIDAKRRCSK